jgi:hypothetical protein
MEILIENKAGRPFLLDKTHLRAVIDDRWGRIRHITKGQVAKVLRSNRAIVVPTYTDYDGKLEIESHESRSSKNSIQIGCQIFVKENFQKIKKWALAKKKVTKSAKKN